MQRHIVLKSPKTTLVARVVADQTLFTPTPLFVFLSSMSVLEGTDPKEKLQKSFLGAYKANLMLWPWVQGVNFAFVPLEHRVLVVNVVSLGEYCLSFLLSLLRCFLSVGVLTGVRLGWNCVLSLINSKR